MPSEMLRGIAGMQISLKTFSARRWRDNSPPSELVFATPGKYKVVYSDVLETDVDYGLQSCEFTVVR